MLRIELTKERKSILLVGAIVLAIAVGYRLVPLLQQASSSEDRLFVEQRIAKLHNKTLQKKELDKKHITLNRHLARLETGLLNGSTPSLAAVDMQNLLYDLAHRHDADVKSVRVMKTEKPEDEMLSMYSKVSIQTHIDLNTGQLKEILYGIAKSPKIIQVKSLEIKTLKGGQAKKFASILTLSGLILNE